LLSSGCSTYMVQMVSLACSAVHDGRKKQLFTWFGLVDARYQVDIRLARISLMRLTVSYPGSGEGSAVSLQVRPR
jgi:hypothetical protein